ncbi:MAG: ClpXP protease specificity-enhancing factor [Proteobacteria bacterium]|nr:ClpXP protease specificity-enhancing factor [Pseudomonadota bacterium]
MTPSRPYLIRALYQWIVDNELTPYIVVDAHAKGVQVPEEFIEGGKIVLNISPTACRGLHLEIDRIIFSARFSGIAQQIFVPPSAVQAIYAKENGRGMMFSEEETSGDAGSGEHIPKAKEPTDKNKKKKPILQIVKK